MAFLNASLLAGGALMAIPVILHLLMRQKPRQLVFPALRFVKERRESNTRRLRLRHWLLLALRCAAVGLVAVALARPSVASALWGNYVALGLVGLALLAALLLAGVAVARKLLVVVWHVLTKRELDRFAVPEKVAATFFAHAYRLGIDNLPEEMNAREYVRHCMDLLGTGQRLGHFYYGKKKISLPEGPPD